MLKRFLFKAGISWWLDWFSVKFSDEVEMYFYLFSWRNHGNPWNTWPFSELIFGVWEFCNGLTKWKGVPVLIVFCIMVLIADAVMPCCVIISRVKIIGEVNIWYARNSREFHFECRVHVLLLWITIICEFWWLLFHVSLEFVRATGSIFVPCNHIHKQKNAWHLKCRAH